MRRRTLLIAACAVLLASCASGGGPVHPAGWTPRGAGAAKIWTDPTHPQERFGTTARASATGTLGDLASQVTTDTLLQHRGAKLLKAQPYPACPGEAGLQTFSLKTREGPARLEVAFTQWNDQAKTAWYRRPAGQPAQAAATQAMSKAVCATL